VKIHQCPIICRPIQRVTIYVSIDKLRAIFNRQRAKCFPKIYETPQTFSDQNVGMKPFPYCRPSNIGYHIQIN